MRPVLISGIQPTGKLHLGNYLGALKNFVDLQNSGKYECYFFIADLHSLTESASGRIDPAEKSKQILDLAADYLAAGLNPKKSTIFIQSQIPAHAELTWILNTITPMGELRRMTQFKNKLGFEIKMSLEFGIKGTDTYFSQKQNLLEAKTNLGLFAYPTLMASDILLYDTQFVPVGDDQLQHLEFARTLARKFNGKFGKTFLEPKALLTLTPRIMSLDEPTKKMSKSRPAGCLFIEDSPNTIREKIKTAVTDSGKEIKYDTEKKPAISNLMLIYSAMSEKTPKEIEKEFDGKNYAEFKNDLAELIISKLALFQKKKKELSKEPAKIKKILNIGQKVAEGVASKKITEVKKRIGLIT